MLDAQTADRLPALEVRGEVDCPRPQEVAEALGRLLGPGTWNDVAELREEDGALVVVVRRASGEVVGEKRVPTSLACPVRAEVAAVSIAALEGQLFGDGDAALVVPPPPRPTPVPAAPAVVVTPAPPPAARAPVAVEVGAEALLSFNGNDTAPAGRLDVAARLPAGAWALGFSAAFVGAHELSIAAGKGTWRRWGSELDLRRVVLAGHDLRLEARAGMALTAISIEGNAYPRNGGATLFDPGASAAVRFSALVGSVRPWLELGGAYWPREHTLTVSIGDLTFASGAIPTRELYAGVGASFGGKR